MWRKHLCLNKTKTPTTKTSGLWLSADIQAQIDPPPTPLIKAELEEQKATNIIKVEIQRNPSQAAPENYKVNTPTLNNGQP